jgi:hypothetical protein
MILPGSRSCWLAAVSQPGARGKAGARSDEIEIDFQYRVG